MRATSILFVALLARVCAAELAPAALAAHHGGTVIAAEDRAVEVVLSGPSVEAWVVDAQGIPLEATTDPITVTVQAETGPTPVVVVWDATSRSYRGTAPAPVVAGPVEVSIVVAGTPRIGRVDTIVVVPAAAAPPTTVVVEGRSPDVRVERPGRAEVTVVAPERPSVVVAPPSPPGVVVVAPSPPAVVVAPPRPSVVVVPPRPPGVVVVPPSPPGVVVVPPRPGTVVIEGDRPRGDRGRHLGHGRGGGGGHGRGRGRGH